MVVNYRVGCIILYLCYNNIMKNRPELYEKSTVPPTEEEMQRAIAAYESSKRLVDLIEKHKKRVEDEANRNSIDKSKS